jgi:PII-like signaling protein
MKLDKRSEAILLRIYIGESDKYKGRPLYQYLVELFKKEKFYGATVLRGITGFGQTSLIRTSAILRLSTDLPVVVEVVDSQEKIDMIKPKLEEIVSGGLITEQTVRIWMYQGE